MLCAVLFPLHSCSIVFSFTTCNHLSAVYIDLTSTCPQIADVWSRRRVPQTRILVTCQQLPKFPPCCVSIQDCCLRFLATAAHKKQCNVYTSNKTWHSSLLQLSLDLLYNTNIAISEDFWHTWEHGHNWRASSVLSPPETTQHRLRTKYPETEKSNPCVPWIILH